MFECVGIQSLNGVLNREPHRADWGNSDPEPAKVESVKDAVSRAS
jgi:hypothetical protein